MSELLTIVLCKETDLCKNIGEREDSTIMLRNTTKYQGVLRIEFYYKTLRNTKKSNMYEILRECKKNYKILRNTMKYYGILQNTTKY